MYDQLLLPVDTSAGVDQAIDHAIDAATRYEATLHVLFVVDTDTYSSYTGDEYVHEFEGLEDALEQAGEEAIESVRARAADARCRDRYCCSTRRSPRGDPALRR